MHTFIFTSSVRYSNDKESQASEYGCISIDHPYEQREREICTHLETFVLLDDRKLLERRVNKKNDERMRRKEIAQEMMMGSMSAVEIVRMNRTDKITNECVFSFLDVRS